MPNQDMSKYDQKATCRRTPTAEDAEVFMNRIGFSVKGGAKYGCFLTGSVAFGEAGPTSDIDIAFPIWMRAVVDEKLRGETFDSVDSNYNNGIKVEVTTDSSALTFNLLFLHPLDYVVWAKAGDMYRLLPRSFCREKRHGIFESLRGIVKCAFAFAAPGVKVQRKNYTMFLDQEPAKQTGGTACTEIQF